MSTALSLVIAAAAPAALSYAAMQVADGANQQDIEGMIIWFGQSIKGIPAISFLIILSIIDFMSGTLVAFDRKKLNSSVSFRGMMKKAMMFMVIAMFIVVGKITGDTFPFAKITAMAFCFTESKSIIENAAALGIRLPSFIIDAFEKARAAKIEKLNQSAPKNPTRKIKE